MIIRSRGTTSDVNFQLDTGATVNVIPVNVLPQGVQLNTCERSLKMWNGTKITPLGNCNVKLQNKKDGKKYILTFVVVKEKLTPLIGKNACEQMGLINVRYDRICSMTQGTILTEYTDVFEGDVGTLPGTVHLTLDESVLPEAVTKSRVAISLKRKVKRKLDKMVKMKVLAKVEEPTNWQ